MNHSKLLLLIPVLLLCGCSSTEDINRIEDSTTYVPESYAHEQELTLDFNFGTRTGIYTGQIENGLPNGYGTFSSSNTSGTNWIYYGEWENGHFSGNGISEWEDGTKYIGEYSNDFMNGKGGYWCNDGNICIGEFKDDHYVPTEMYSSNHSTPIPAITDIPDVIQDSATSYVEGTYIVGKTIPSGDYIVFPTRDSVNATIEISSDSLNNFDSLLFMEEFENFSYIHLNDGEYVTVEDGTLTVWNGDSLSALSGTSNIVPGTYIVGVDIPAGEYELVSNGSLRDAHYVLYSEIPSSKENIFVSAEYYKNNGFLTVSDGQYLVFRNATLNFVK